MDNNLRIVNQKDMDEQEMYEVGGSVACVIACAGGCLISYMTAAAMAVITADMS